MSIIPHAWAGGPDDDPWDLAIQHDHVGDTDSEFGVEIAVTDGDNPLPVVAMATPAQAREMASALMVYAFFADRVNKERDEEREQI